MRGGLGPRFALEAGFLILLAAVATYAQLETEEIILVMAGGWLVASVFEVLAARRERFYPGALWERRGEADAAEEERPAEAQPSPEPPASPEEEEAVAFEPAPAPTPGPLVDDEATGQIELPKRRRWFRRGEEPEPASDEAAVRPSARHVRLIRDPAPPDGAEERKDAEAGS